MEPNGYQFPQIVFSSGERQVWPDGALAGGPHHYSGRWSSDCFGFTWGARGVPQNAVGASANSLWQGGWRRTHSVKGGLPK